MMNILRLTSKSVSLVTGKSAEGCDSHIILCNSPSGRATLIAEQPPEIVAEVMAVWGDTPTVPDEPPRDDPPYTPTTDPRDLAIAQLMRDVAELKGGAAHV